MTRNKRAITALRALALALAAVTLTPAALAVTTRIWVSTSFADFNAGDGAGVLITSDGRLRRGEAVTRVALDSVDLVFALHETGNAVYLGTGTKGQVWRYRGGKARKLATLPGALIVTCFAKGPAGVLYAGTLPEGRIYEIRTATGKTRPFARVAAKHVWALHYDAKQQTLYAGTGPKGKLYAIDAAGKAQVYWDSGETHVLSLAQGPGGSLYAGTAPKAIVYRLLGKGRVRAMHDFAGTEVRALVGNAKGLYAAVNAIKADRSSELRIKPGARAKGGTPLPKGKGAKRKYKIPRLGAKKGKGALFAIDATGAAQPLYGVRRGYFTALQLDPQGRLYAAEGTRGQVVTVLPDRSTAVAYNVKERQVLSLAVTGKLRVFGTGDSGVLYRMGGKKPPTYVSDAYDTGNVSRFGLLSWRASGPLMVEARSGNTAKPDDGWSPWRKVARRGRAVAGTYRARLRAPPGRYVQFRLRWLGNARSTVKAVRLYFTPKNRAPVWHGLQVGDIGTGRTKVQKAVWIGSDKTAAPAEQKIQWKVGDPDGDPLVYRVSYRAVGDALWRRVGDDEVVKGKSIKWNTANLPDGWYEVRVEASDEKTNAASRLQRRAKISAPVLVDHGKPDLVGLKVAYPRLTGLARDRYSRIAGVAYSLDGKTWTQLSPADGSWDQEAERFDARMLGRLDPGLYTLLVRAYDEAGNARVVKRTLRVR